MEERWHSCTARLTISRPLATIGCPYRRPKIRGDEGVGGAGTGKCSPEAPAVQGGDGDGGSRASECFIEAVELRSGDDNVDAAKESGVSEASQYAIS